MQSIWEAKGSTSNAVGRLLDFLKGRYIDGLQRLHTMNLEPADAEYLDPLAKKLLSVEPGSEAFSLVETCTALAYIKHPKYVKQVPFGLVSNVLGHPLLRSRLAFFASSLA